MTIDSGVVSVVIPVHNGEAYLSEAIESVLGQSNKSLEVIVVDDGSTDRSREIIDQYVPRVKYMHQTQGGPSAARNKGVAFVQGEYIAFLDCDDIWMVDKISQQMAAFENEPDLDMIFGNALQFQTPGLQGYPGAPATRTDEILQGYIPSAMLIKKESFFKVGLFDENYLIGEWLDWYSRAVDKGLSSRMLSEVVVHRRIHTTNTGITNRDNRSGYLYALKSSLDRRRQNRPSGD